MRQPSQNPATDQSANFFWILIMIIGFGIIFWLLEKKDIITVLFYIRYYEIMAIYALIDPINKMGGWLHLPQL